MSEGNNGVLKSKPGLVVCRPGVVFQNGRMSDNDDIAGSEAIVLFAVGDFCVTVDVHNNGWAHFQIHDAQQETIGEHTRIAGAWFDSGKRTIKVMAPPRVCQVCNEDQRNKKVGCRLDRLVICLDCHAFGWELNQSGGICNTKHNGR